MTEKVFHDDYNNIDTVVKEMTIKEAMFYCDKFIKGHFNDFWGIYDIEVCYSDGSIHNMFYEDQFCEKRGTFLDWDNIKGIILFDNENYYIYGSYYVDEFFFIPFFN